MNSIVAAGTASVAARRRFIAGLGIGQIVSWGSFYYAFPLIAPPMGAELGLSKPEIYGAATFGLVIGSLANYPVGSAIDRGYGRALMTAGSIIGGLLMFGWAEVMNLWSLYLLFAGIGLVQAMTLYEPAFAVVARRYGENSRGGITALTLWGGFASTVFVPLTQWLLDLLAWRDALIALGAINLVLCVALHLAVIDPKADAPARPAASGAGGSRALSGRDAVRWALGKPAFWGLLVSFTVYYGTFSAMTYHLYPLLLEHGFDTTSVVGGIAIIGPAQVAGRVAIWAFARDWSVRTIGLATTALFPVSVLLLFLPAEFAALAVFAVVYGAANGVMTIVRGTAVPEMITRDAYGALNGFLVAPGTAARAVGPVAGALVWAASGSYDLFLIAAIVCSVLVGLSFAAAASFKT
ncbi:MAG TPA: MFS transporter [Stellaceae bacterium]|nr:MFS transporter [Stellaceae bacterium]